MTKRVATILTIAVLLCTALASLLLAEGGVGPFSITSHDPPANEVGVALNANVQATFDDDVNAGTVTNDTFVVHGHLGGLAGGSFGYDGGTRTVTLDPARAFHAGEVLRVSATAAISSTGGTGLTPYGWQFTAGPVMDRCWGSFTDIGAGLPPLSAGAVAWGDYDNDGDLDILLAGLAPLAGPDEVAKVFRNDGASGFTDIGAGLTGVDSGSVAWGDYDNDGDLDILLTGGDWPAGTVRTTTVYRNDGGGAFADIGAGLTAVSHGSGEWGDYDNDGDLDILLTGRTGSGPVSIVYRNDGAPSAFTDIGAGLTAVEQSSAAWGDYDNDGDLDIVLAGISNPATYDAVSKVYRNDGSDTFANIGAGLRPLGDGAVAWGDYDNDGDLDILLVGVCVHQPRSALVYRNDGGGIFTDIGAGLTGVEEGFAAWGDYDNDGDLDILLNGFTGSNRVTRVYRNNGGASPAFTNIAAGLTRTEGSGAWGDYDNDGDLDILLTGFTGGSTYVTNVYRNDDCPGIIAHQPAAQEVGVAVAAAIHATFNTDIDVGTVTSRTFSVHGHLGGLASGSFAYDGGTKTITLDPDRNFHAGEVLRVSATEAISTTGGSGLTPYGWQFTAGPVLDRCPGAFIDIGAGLPGVRYSSVAWGDYDNDGDLDILLTGGTGAARVALVYRNNGDESFTDISAGLTAVNQGAVAWGDYDHDGDLDILLTGDSGSGYVSRVYRNDGSDVFTDIGAGLTGVQFSAVAWGDYDNDGDLDILLTGGTGAGRVAVVYRNDGASGFTDIGAGLTGVNQGSAAWGDVDNDGDLDILLTGQDSSDTPLSKVYRNDGTSGFSDIGAALTPVWYSSVAWGDVDNDSHLDILLTGRDVAGSPLSKVYRNNGDTASPAFSDIGAALVAVNRGSVAWSDMDNDGDLDIVLTGYDGTGRAARVYRNDGGSGFTDTGVVLTGVNQSSVACGDYDNDGDLDILLTGNSDSGYVSKLYRNEDCPDLGLAKSVDVRTPQPGQRITYTIVITNSGGTATGTVVSDTLPADVTFAGPVGLEPPGAGTVGEPPIVVSDAVVRAGETITVSIPVTLNTGLAVGTMITNTVAISVDQVVDVLRTSVGVTVANARPNLGTVDPSSGSGSTGVTTYFTTTWSDANGWQDLKQCYFHIGDSPSIVGNVTLMYNAAKNKLWLRTDDGTAWFGGYAPGSANTVENGQAIVDCSLTTVQGAGDTLGVTWAIEFKAGYTGAKKLGLKCKDRDKAKAKGKWKGTWTIE
jgi:uncharacterized repeat protein (TIGR01451 family)